MVIKKSRGTTSNYWRTTIKEKRIEIRFIKN